MAMGEDKKSKMASREMKPSTGNQTKKSGGNHSKKMVECKFGAKCTKGKNCPFLHTQKGEKKELTGREAKNEQKRLRMERKMKKPEGELVFKAKEIWNNLRLVDLDKKEREVLVLKLNKLLSGKVVDICLKHDGSRIIQSLYKYGTQEQRSALTAELLKSIIPICKTKHGRFLAISMLRYGSKKDIEAFLDAIRGNLFSMATHQIASHVIEYAYEEILSARQSFLLFEELYHRQYINVKDTEAQSIHDIVKKVPFLKNQIIENLSNAITKLINKGLLDHSFAHKVIYEYIQIADPKRVMILMDQLDTAFPALSTTALGSKAAVEGLNYCNNKNKKKIIKSYKGIIVDTCVHQFGFAIMIKLLYCVDDMVILNKSVFSEMSQGYDRLLASSRGCRVLLSIIVPKSRRYFTDDMSWFEVPTFTIKNDKGENEEICTAKKDYDVRVKELQAKLNLTPVLLESASIVASNPKAVPVLMEYMTLTDEETKEKLAAVRVEAQKIASDPNRQKQEEEGEQNQKGSEEDDEEDSEEDDDGEEDEDNNEDESEEGGEVDEDGSSDEDDGDEDMEEES